MTLFVLFILTWLIATSLLFTWFKSSMPSLVFAFLKKLGWKRKDPNFWKTPSDEYMSPTSEARSPLTWSRMDWEGSDKGYEGWAQTRLGNFFGELLTCRYCLCYHVVFWTNLLVFLFTGMIITSWNWMLMFIFAQPILVHVIFNIVEFLEGKHD